LKAERIYLVMTGLFVGLVISSCQERNPDYIEKVGDASVGRDAPLDSPGNDARLSDSASSLSDGPGSDLDGPATASDAGGGTEVALPDGRDPRDSRDVRKSDEDVLPDVIEDAVGQEDAVRDLSPSDVRDAPAQDSANIDGSPRRDTGLDGPPSVVDVGADLSSSCQENDKQTCSSSTYPRLGACSIGTQTCTGGVWGACIFPAPTTEICNGIDDNCNGMVDEGCTEDCIVVAPGKDDGGMSDGTVAHPYRTIEAALAMASEQDGGAPKRVCVAGGTTCAEATTYVLDIPLAMANGSRMQGNYALTDSGLIYCASTQPPTTTLQFKASQHGVVFGESVVLPTELSGFVIERFSGASITPSAAAISAILVNGGTGVTLSGIFVTDAPTGDTTYGVDVENGGQATLVGSSISGGQGRSSAIGVYVNGGSVNLLNNCDTYSQGICNTSCSSTSAVLGIRGRSSSAAGSIGMADTSAVYITKASPSTSSIVGNTLCGGTGDSAVTARSANLATLHCESGACATIAGNNITAGTGRETLAVNLVGGFSLVDKNLIVAGCGIDTSTGLVLDDTKARLQNNRILGGQCTSGPATISAVTFYGVHILLGSSAGEPDVHSNDIDPMGASGNCQSIGVAIDRSSGTGASAGILRNNLISAGNCRKRFAVEELSNTTARVVENNDLYEGESSSATDTSVLYHRGDTDALTAEQVNMLAGAANNISASPKFASYPTNLHLTADSLLCIDHGTAEGAPATDADGNSRPQGNGYDIGAYEFSSQ
jgi:hypothetical protein